MQPTPVPPTPVPLTSGAAGRRRRAWLFWPAVVVALAAVVGGAVVAAAGYSATRGPGGAVRGYFEALQRSDAAAALGFGDVPPGPRTLLTSAVLREQQRIAPIVALRVGAVTRTGSRASVQVSYALRYPDGDSPVTVRVPVHERDGVWQLEAAAVPTRLTLEVAGQRASVLGRLLPAGDVLAFPGAPPIRFDTGYLTLDPSSSIVPAAAGDPPDGVARSFAVRITPTGRAAMQRAVLAAVRGCLSAAHPAATCPLPTARYVPGSVHGTVAGTLRGVSVSLDATGVGTLDLSATVPVEATAYQRLDFYNRVLSGSGRITLAVRAIAAARAPLAVSWLSP